MDAIRKADIDFPRATANSSGSGLWGTFLLDGTTSRGLHFLFWLNPFRIMSTLLLPTLAAPMMLAMVRTAVFIVVLRRRPMMAVPSPRRRRRPPIPSVRAIIIRRRPIVDMASVNVHRHVPSP
jgi:hypothetical protein